MGNPTGKITRRSFLKTASVASAAAATGLYGTSAHAAEFTFKYANNAIADAHSRGINWWIGMYLLEMESWMSRVLTK